MYLDFDFFKKKEIVFIASFKNLLKESVSGKTSHAIKTKWVVLESFSMTAQNILAKIYLILKNMYANAV